VEVVAEEEDEEEAEATQSAREIAAMALFIFCDQFFYFDLPPPLSIGSSFFLSSSGLFALI
jgi:hypothetical protein